MADSRGRLCPELYATILGQLWNDHEALRTCSLTCSILLPFAQSLLFKKITVLFGPDECYSHSSPYIRGSQLKAILATSPHIGVYVEVLDIMEMSSCDANWFLEEFQERITKGLGKDESLAGDTALNFCLPLLSRLKALSTHFCYSKFLETYWASAVQTGVLTSLVATTSLSSLTSLFVYGIPLSLISYCPNLQHLWLEGPLESDHNDEKTWFAAHITTLPKRIQLRSLAIQRDLSSFFTEDFLSRTVDLSTLKTLFIKSSSRRETNVQAFIEPCVNNVEELIFDPFHQGIFATNLGNFKSLRKLYIRLEIHGQGPFVMYSDPLPSFLDLLRALQSLNPSKLEEITLHVEYYRDSRINMSVWREISDLLIDKGRFPCFCKLNLRINISTDRINQETYDVFNIYTSNIHDRNVAIQVDCELFEGVIFNSMSPFWPDSVRNSLFNF